MDRRVFLKGTAQVGVTVAALSQLQPGSPLLAQSAPAMRAVAHASADQQGWQDLELGMFVHFAPNTWQNKESDDLSTPLSEIDPKELNTDQWAQTAVNLGAKYIVFVAKHQGGFCMWQTNTTDYSIKNTPWKDGKGDVVAEVSASCRKYELKLGIYCCPRDDHFGARTGGICATPALQAKYDKMYREQLTEVWSRYGQLVEIWFDGSTITPVADLLKKYQPHAMIFQGPQATIRWVGNENGFAPYPCWNGIDRTDAETGTATSLQSNPNGTVWMPVECDVSIRRPDWFWHTDNADKVLNEDQLLSIYYRSVGRGAQFLLNIPANRHGLLPEKDAGVAKQFGDTLRTRFAKPLASTSGTGRTVTLHLPQETPVDTVILQEETTHGERVRGFRLEGLTAQGWQKLADGSAIGHKRIQPVGAVAGGSAQPVRAIRLVVTEAAASPMIRTLAAFHTGTPPPADWNATSELWAANLAGSWKGTSFSLDLTKQIKAATQYRLRFVASQGKITGIRNPVLKLHGVPEPAMVHYYPSHPDQLLLDITGVDETVLVTGEIEGATAGEVLLQKL